MNHNPAGRTSILSAIVVATACLYAPHVRAADNCTGTYTHVVVMAETSKTDEGLAITSFMNQGSTSSSDSMYSGTGACAGFNLRTPDGTRTTRGACTRKHKDGGTWSFTFAFAPKGHEGTWQATGGTGAFSGKKGSGWFKGSQREGEVSTGTWGGTCD